MQGVTDLHKLQRNVKPLDLCVGEAEPRQQKEGMEEKEVTKPPCANCDIFLRANPYSGSGPDPFPAWSLWTPSPNNVSKGRKKIA